MGADDDEINEVDDVDESDVKLEAEDDIDVSIESYDLASPSLTAKEMERKRIQSEVEEFLSRGGQITQVESRVMTDPPKRPVTDYGGQPI